MEADTSKHAAALVATIDFAAGALGGTANVLVGQPLDTVKVKLQAYPNLYKHAFDCFARTLRSEGVTKGLYRGTVPSLVANIAENSVLFCAYGFCQSAVGHVAGVEVKQMTAWHNATAGFFASFFSSLVICPTELIKCRLQTLTESSSHGHTVSPKNITPWQLTRQIVHEYGITGLFRGLTSTCVKEMPGYFMFFGGYEFTRNMMVKPGKTKDDLGILETILAGGIGGCCFWISVFPADVVKSRIQVLPHTQKLTFTSMFNHILRTEGIGALYSGIKPTLLRTFPATAALFVVYEYSKSFFMDTMISDE